MAAGDLVVANYQYEFNSLLIGSQTDYIVTAIEGLLSLPDVRSHDLDRQDRHGAIGGRDLLSGRKVIFDLSVIANSQGTIESNLRQLSRAFRPSSVDIPLVWQRPAGGPKRRLNCRPRRREFTAGYDVAHMLAEGAVELFAADPRIYSNDVSTQDFIIPNSGNSVTANLHSYGDFPTPPTLTITGPVTNPRISNVADNNRQIRLDVVMTAGQTLVVDVGARTVTLDGADRYDLVRGDNQWWEIQDGDNSITYNRTDTGAGSTLTMTWRDAWM
jgi:hypothetical protein